MVYPNDKVVELGTYKGEEIQAKDEIFGKMEIARGFIVAHGGGPLQGTCAALDDNLITGPGGYLHLWTSLKRF